MALNQVECRRCGLKWVVTSDKKDARDLLCKSCRQGRQKVIQYGNLRCKPYEGDLNDDLQPIDKNGDLYLPGVRSCGHLDCVNPQHIVAG